MSPLDNGIFHEWKERVRHHHPLTKNNIVSVIVQEQNKITSNELGIYYKHCELIDKQNVYKDRTKQSCHSH